MGIKTYQEKNTKPIKKELAQSDIAVRRKVPKITPNVNFLRKNSPPIGRNWASCQFQFGTGWNGPKTLLTCIIHDNKSYWLTLGPFWYPRRAQKGPFGPGPPSTGINWASCQFQSGTGWNGSKTLLTCMIHDNKSYWPLLGPIRYPRKAQKGPFGPCQPPHWGQN